MTYSVWMDGMKIGDSSLELSHGGGRRAGVFHPTAPGLAVLPGITAMAPALLDAGRAWREEGLTADSVEADADDSIATSLFERPEGHRVLEAAKLVSRLELHGPDGELIPWESILISDMNDLAALGRSKHAGGRKKPERARRDPIRYFISAKFEAPQRVSSRRAREQRMS